TNTAPRRHRSANHSGRGGLPLLPVTLGSSTSSALSSSGATMVLTLPRLIRSSVASSERLSGPLTCRAWITRARLIRPRSAGLSAPARDGAPLIVPAPGGSPDGAPAEARSGTRSVSHHRELTPPPVSHRFKQTSRRA